MDVISTGFGVLVAVLLLVLIGAAFFISRMFRKVEQGKALIVSKVRRVDVTFTGTVVLPVLHKAETMDISVKTIEILRTGREGLICRDNIRADIRITFFVRVNKTTEDVIKVAQAIGTERASSEQTLQELFNAKFSEALKTVGKQLDFVDLYTKRNEFRDQIIASRDIRGNKPVDYPFAAEIADDILARFEAGDFDVATLFYSEFRSVISQIPTAQKLIPAELPTAEGAAATGAGSDAAMEFEPNEETILETLLPKNLTVQIFRALLENAASEQGARTGAMDSATRNAGEMIKKQTQIYNRTRQAMITKELIEIISGAEAL